MKGTSPASTGATIEDVPALHIRNVPEATMLALKRRAHLHQVSMQQELLAILEQAAAEPVEAVLPRRIDLHLANTGRTEPFDRADIYRDDEL